MRASALLAFLLVILISSLVIGGFWADQRITEKERMVDYLLSDVEKIRADNTRLAEENARLSKETETLSEQLDGLKTDLASAEKEADAMLVPQEIGGSADFPIERGMAKDGESVTAFAKRGGTSVEVLKALNPWLDPKTSLKKYQTLWLPTK